jgi:hypothetical protein
MSDLQSASPPSPRTRFEWPVYSNATLAGLSALVPIPLLDMVFESYFSRRIPGIIARHRGVRLEPQVIGLLNRGSEDCLTTCLLFPFRLMLELVKSLSRKILYFLSIKQATDLVSYYWHRAFLIDYMLQQGHLADLSTAQMAQTAMHQVIRTSTTSPLYQLAGQLATSSKGIFRALRRARRQEADGVIEGKRDTMRQNWARFEPYLQSLAARYDLAFQTLRSQPPPE